MRKALLALTMVFYATAASAYETRGTVVYNRGCGSRIVVQTPQGHAIAVWLDGVAPYEGQTLAGDFNAVRLEQVYNVNTDGGGTLRVEAYGLSRGRAVQALKSKCR